MAGPPAVKTSILSDVIKFHDIIIVYVAQYVNMFLKKVSVTVSGSARSSMNEIFLYIPYSQVKLLIGRSRKEGS